MLRIVSDTSTLYSSTQAVQAGFEVSPLSVTIAGESFREFDEIQPKEFVEKIHQGHLPTSSQPAIGEVVELYEKYPGDEILNISMAAGLSGTYDSAVAAVGACEAQDRITVLNSRTLCGPHRHLVERAVEWAKAGMGRVEVVAKLEELMKSEKSFLIPADFAYLRRGGRLSPLVSYVGQTMSLAPVMTLTEDARQLTVAGVRRGFVQAVKYVGKALEKLEVGRDWKVYITHADAREMADKAHALLKELFPQALFEIYPLSPAFITQGGPGCVAIQVIRA